MFLFRKSSVISLGPSTFDLVTQRLEALPSDVSSFSAEQIVSITEHIMLLPKDEDVMSLAKNASKNLYSDLSGAERVDKINVLVSMLIRKKKRIGRSKF